MELIKKHREMFGKVIIPLGLTLFWLLPLAQSARADYDYELDFYRNGASEYRNAADAADLIERGQASVTDSPEFRDGIRLTAWATEEEKEFEPGLASAIYYFDVPSWTRYLRIRVRYRDVSKDDDVAGRLWIKTLDRDWGEATESEEENLFYGDTFILRSNRTSETIYVSSGRYVEDGTVEIHIVASGRDSLDVDYIRVEYLKKEPTRIRIVDHWCDDYWYRWPPYWYGYHYFYWGPCYWPRTRLIYVRWIWPHTYYWHRYRPWYHIWIAKYHRHHPHWYRRYSHIHRGHSGGSLHKKRIQLHRWVKKRPERREKRREALLANSHTPLATVQRSRGPAGFKPLLVVPSETGARKTREGCERLQFRGAPRKSNSKPVFREGSQARSRALGFRGQAVMPNFWGNDGRGGSMVFRHQKSRR